MDLLPQIISCEVRLTVIDLRRRVVITAAPGEVSFGNLDRSDVPVVVAAIGVRRPPTPVVA